MGAIQASLARDPGGIVRDKLDDYGNDFTRPLVGKTGDGRILDLRHKGSGRVYSLGIEGGEPVVRRLGATPTTTIAWP